MKNKKNVIMEQLYDMAGNKEADGSVSFDEAKLKRELTQGQDKNFLRPNKDIFDEGEPKFRTCKRYNPCPMCEKCKSKASNLYVSCQNCNIPICVHTFKTINKMIVRRNFIIEPKDKSIIQAIKKMESDYNGAQSLPKEPVEKLR